MPRARHIRHLSVPAGVLALAVRVVSLAWPSRTVCAVTVRLMWSACAHPRIACIIWSVIASLLPDYEPAGPLLYPDHASGAQLAGVILQDHLGRETCLQTSRYKSGRQTGPTISGYRPVPIDPALLARVRDGLKALPCQN